jgi:hypothetical protein
LSKWYLAPSIVESIINIYFVLLHVLGCLAKLAAQDCWFLSQNKSEYLIPLDRDVENDFYLTCGILESLPIKFPCLKIS